MLLKGIDTPELHDYLIKHHNELVSYLDKIDVTQIGLDILGEQKSNSTKKTIYKNSNFSDNINLFNFFEKEFETIKPEETKTYIIHDLEYKEYINSDNKYPVIFFLNSNYILKIVKSRFTFYDKKFNYLCAYYSAIEQTGSIYHGDESIDYSKKLKASIFRIETNNLYKDNHYDQRPAINIHKKMSLSIKPSYYGYDSYKIHLNMSKTKKIESIAIDDKLETFTVYFQSSFYMKMIFDYSFNILAVDFSSIVKNKLNLTSLKNVNSYQSLLNAITDNIDIYTLTTDNQYSLKMNEKDFNFHINVIKGIVNNRKKIVKKYIDIVKIIDNLSIDHHYALSYSYAALVNERYEYFDYSKNILGINPFENINTKRSWTTTIPPEMTHRESYFSPLSVLLEFERLKKSPFEEKLFNDIINIENGIEKINQLLDFSSTLKF